MAPPGRRKQSLLDILPLLILCLLVSTTHAASAALGIDLGTEYIKAAVAKPGSPIEIVLTKDSKRKEAATLAFKPARAQTSDQDAYPERLYGGDAVALSARYPADVFANLKPLLGLPVYDDSTQSFSARYPELQLEGILRENSNVGTVGIRSKNLGKPEPFMVEELLAMQLKNIKANAEQLVGNNNFVKDVVITHPAFYTAEEKRAIELAADLAGLRVLGLLSDGLSVGLNYATNRNFDSVSDGAAPEYHVIYDMGAGSTTATVVKFQGRTVRGPGKRNQTVQEVIVVGTGYDRSLGGDAFNDLIVRDMISKFLSSPAMKKFQMDDIHVRKDGKTMARLWKDAEKIRQVLSANNQASASFEGLFYEDVNFKYSLSRTEFEKMSETHSDRIALPLHSALTMSGLTAEDLTSVILHGGMTRTPFVQQHLEEISGRVAKVKTNVNADEAAAFGAAFKAAALSPSFRVKDIRTSDVAGNTYTMSWAAEGKERQQKIFVEASQTGIEKQVPVKVLMDASFEFTQNEGHKITVYHATNLTKSVHELQSKYGCASANIITSLAVRLGSFDSLPEIISGSVSCTAEKGTGGVVDNVKGLFGFGSKKDQQPLKEDEEQADEVVTEQTPLPVDDPTSSTTVVSASPSMGSVASLSSSSAAAKATSATVTIPLSFSSNMLGPGAPPKARLPMMRSRLTAFDTSDRNSMLRAEALNILEAFTYKARDYVEDQSFIQFSTQKTRNELAQKLADTSEWLYGEGMDAKQADFQKRLKELKALVEPVLSRKEESSKRTKAVEVFENGLSSASGMIDMVKASIERAASDAASSVGAAASSAAGSASSLVATLEDDLEDEPYTATTDAGPSETEAPVLKPYEYTQDDLNVLQKAFDSAKTWFNEKYAAQKKLNSVDDPVLLVAELEKRSQTLQNAVSEIIMKQINMPKSKSKKAKSTKTKGKKTKSTTASSDNGSSTTTRKEEL